MTLSPQLATLVDAAPQDAGSWTYELKFDGYRILSRADGSDIRLLTRNGHDWPHKLAHLAKAIKALRAKGNWLDGEAVAVGAQGRPDFQKLQNAFDGSDTAGLVYYVFDLPFANGKDLRNAPLEVRRNHLHALLARSTSEVLRLSETFETQPGDLVAFACDMEYQGIIGKRNTSAYKGGRSSTWIKLKSGLRQEFVIGGYTPPKGSRTALGPLLLGYYDEDGLLHCAGNVGSGFTDQSLHELHGEPSRLHGPSSPFASTRGAPSQTQWVLPKLVAEVAFAQWTQDRRIRHSVFKGLRKDKPARDIRCEEATQRPSGTRHPTVRAAHAPHRRLAHGHPHIPRRSRDRSLYRLHQDGLGPLLRHCGPTDGAALGCTASGPGACTHRRER